MNKLKALLIFLLVPVVGLCSPADTSWKHIDNHIQELQFEKAKSLLKISGANFAKLSARDKGYYHLYLGKLNEYYRAHQSAYYYYMEAYRLTREVPNNDRLISEVFMRIHAIKSNLINKKEFDKIQKRYFDMVSITKDTTVKIDYLNWKGLTTKNNFRIAQQYFQDELLLASSNPNRFPRRVIKARFNEALLLKDVGFTQQAIDSFNKIVRLCKEYQKSVPEANAHKVLGLLYLEQKNSASAKFHFDKSLLLALQVNDLEVAKEVLRAMVKYELENGNSHLSKSYYVQLDSLQKIWQQEYKKNTNSMLDIMLNDWSIKEEMQKQNSRQNQQLLLYSALSLIALLSFLILLFHYRNAKKRMKLVQLLKEQEMQQERINSQQLQLEMGAKILKAELKGHRNEREYLAMELHDSVANSLGGIKSKMQTILHYTQESNSKIELSKTIGDLDKVYHEVRNMSHTLSSKDFNKEDIHDVLLVMFEEFEKNNSLAIEYSIFPEKCLEVLSVENKYHIYNIIQELLMNVAKHANASEISVNISRLESYIIIIFEDNGDGMSNVKEGVGLGNIRTRINYLKGEFETFSSLTNGMAIHLKIPI